MDDVCARPSCREMRRHAMAYCSDACYAAEIWRVVGDFNRRMRRRQWMIDRSRRRRAESDARLNR